MKPEKLILSLSGCKSWVEKRLPDKMAKSQGNKVFKLGWKEFPEKNMKTKRKEWY